MNAQSLIAWLPFDESTTQDLCGGTWTAYNSPTIEDDALQLNGTNQYLALDDGITLGGQDFTVHCWIYFKGNTSGNYNRIWEMQTANGLTGVDLPNVSRIRMNVQSTENWFNASMVNVRRHVAMVYEHDKSLSTLYIDGVAVGSKTLTIARATSTRFCIGKYTGSDACYFYGSIEDFQIYDGVALWTENFTPPTQDDYVQLRLDMGLPTTLNFSADIERKISNAVEATFDVERKFKWRYVNAGDASDLLTSGTTLTDLDETKSKTGTAFYQTTCAKCFDLPATDEIWIKFDVYFNGSTRWRAYNGGSNGTTGATAQTNGDFNVWVNDANNGATSNVCVSKTLQTVLLHMVSDSSTGIVEAWVDGAKTYTYTGDVNHGDDFEDFYLQSDGAGTFFSNVIISNCQIGLDDGFQIFSIDAERRIKNRVQVSADVQRNIILPIVVPLIGEHFNHSVQSLTLFRDAPQKIILPKRSVAYIRATGNCSIKVFSDTDNTGKVTGAMYAGLDECNSVFIQLIDSPLNVIRRLIKYFVEHNGSRINDAINYATGGKYPHLNRLENEFCAKINNLPSGNFFLEEHAAFLAEDCGIILGNEDTGAITGSDAGEALKTAQSVVSENISPENWGTPLPNSTMTIYGLTVHFPSVGADGSTLTDAENHILAGLNSVWIKSCLQLIKISLGIGFDSETAFIHDLDIKFVNSVDSHFLAYVEPTIYHDLRTMEDEITGLSLIINMYFYSDIDFTSEDGLLIPSSSHYDSAGYLDRSLAHELTHAVMMANIRKFLIMQPFMTEGLAEIVHGIDDLRGGAIINLLTKNHSSVREEIQKLYNGTVTENTYAVGYMFLRYLAKQSVSDSFVPETLVISDLLISDGATDFDYNALTDYTRQKFFSDLLRTLIKTTSANFDIEILDVFPVEVPLDVLRYIQAKLTLLSTDTSEYFPSGGDSSVEREPVVIPPVDIPIHEHPQEPALQTHDINAEEIQSFEISISEQQLTPRVTFTTTRQFQIGQVLELKYLDTYFKLQIESVRKQGILYTYECCHNLDELLYTQLDYVDSEDDDSDDNDDSKFLDATEQAEEIAVAMFGKKNCKIQFAGFVSTLKREDIGGLTYSDLISSLFGWTARIPPILINVFFFKEEFEEKLYFIQRGKEINFIDITMSKHNIPVKTQELVRMIWGSSPTTETEITSDVTTPSRDDDDDDEQWTTAQDVSTGTNWIATTTYYYIKKKPFAPLDPQTGAETGKRDDKKAGLLEKVEIDKRYTDRSSANSFTQILHSYDDDGIRIKTETYVKYSAHENKPPDTTTINKLRYITLPNGEKFLASEATEQYEDGELVDSTTTTHSPSRLGQTHAVKITADGIAGEAFGQDTGDDRITPYKQRRTLEIVNPQKTNKKSHTIKGHTFFDTSFPVHNEEFLIKLTEIIEKLNRSIKSTLSITLYDYPHLINFTDCIVFEEEKFCLVSNTARTNNRVKNEQNLVLVNRWDDLLPDD